MNSTQLNQTFIHSDEPFPIFLLIYITTIFFSCVAILSSIIFISIIIFTRSLRTVANILTVNSSVAILLLSSDTLSIAIYVLYRDVKQQQSQMPVPMKNLFLCHVRGYIAHISFCILIYSYVIQAFYRLASIIFYHRIVFQHWKIYAYAICIQWFIGSIQLLPIAIGNNQVFIKEEYLCQMAIENSKAIGYINTTNYLIPLTIIMIIYSMITKSVRERENNGGYRYNIHRARRQMILTRRILILISILLVLGGPYSAFIIMEAFSIKRAPSYSHRIGFMCIAIAAALSILTIIYFTRPTRKIIKKFLTIGKGSQQRGELQRLNNRRSMVYIPKRMQQATTEKTGTT